MDLPIGIILIIINLLPIPDIRNLIKCDSKLNLLHSKNILSIIDINSLKWEHKLNFELINPHYYKYMNAIHLKQLSEKQKYTFENSCYGYRHLLLDRDRNNFEIYCYGPILVNAVYNNFWDFIKFNIKIIKGYSTHIAKVTIILGNLKILKYLKQLGYKFHGPDWHHAVKARHIRVLKWANNNGYEFNPLLYEY